MDFLEAITKLAEAQVEFSVHYPSKGSAVIVVAGTLTNIQLRTVVELGGAMNPQGGMMILTDASEAII